MTFSTLDAISAIDAISYHCPDRLAGENPLLGHFCLSLM
jgi:hypothetical protein